MTKEPTTKKGKYNALVKRAEKISEELRKLQKKAEQLAEDCAEFGESVDYDQYIYNLQYLKETAEDLAAFDFEDSIPERAKYNF